MVEDVCAPCPYGRAVCEECRGASCWQSKERHDAYIEVVENTRKALFRSVRAVMPTQLRGK